jgi:hypothetical protein
LSVIYLHLKIWLVRHPVRLLALAPRGAVRILYEVDLRFVTTRQVNAQSSLGKTPSIGNDKLPKVSVF